MRTAETETDKLQVADKHNRIAFHHHQYSEWDWCWCMNKAKISTTAFCIVHYYGYMSCRDASYFSGVRPAFLIIQ